MVVKNIHIEELKEYIDETFYGDDEILNCYDKTVPVTRITDVCESVFTKIESLQQSAEIRGIEIGGMKVGYFVFHPSVLLSFGINSEYREKEYLIDFWETINTELGGTFQVALFSYNRRAINWLQKCGMKILFDNATLMSCP